MDKSVEEYGPAEGKMSETNINNEIGKRGQESNRRMDS